MKKLSILLLLFSPMCFAQQQQRVLVPSDIEQATLAKLIAQKQNYSAQKQLLLLQLSLMDQYEKSKESELGAKAQQIVTEHKWNATYDSTKGESGIFVELPPAPQKTEPKKDK